VTLRIVEGWRGLSDEDRGASVALGAFDGLHRGHEHVVAAAKAASGPETPLGLVSFEPHPFRWFHPDAEPFLLMSHAQQGRALERLGGSLLYILPFNGAMTAMTDEDFSRDVLAAGLGVKHVAAGFDFRFGHDRMGDAESLRRHGQRYGFGVTIVDKVDDAEGHKLSSSAIRAALHEGDPKTAAAILGHPFAIEGRVVEGRGKGRPLGFPTANVSLGDYIRPRLGIYAAVTRLPDGREVKGVAYVGPGAAVEAAEPRLEVWLFDFDEDLYGQEIEVALVDFIRPDRDFDSLEALQAQVAEDARRARELLANL
jgi:riboflavin kinase / FMN adenylyltransferase